MKEQLEKLVQGMYQSGIRYGEAVRQFQKTFIIVVLRDHKGNQIKAAGKLGMHRNTLRRTIKELEVDIKTVRVSRRRPPVSTGLSAVGQKKAGTP